MCGIAGIHRLTNRPMVHLDRMVSALLAGIENRGQDATGYVAVNDAGDVQLQKASCRAFYFNSHRARVSDDARTVLLHTRFATQGKPSFPENNHPVESGGIYAVHNGHISNDRDIFDALCVERRGAVDSEAIPALIARRGWDAAPAYLGELDGDMATALVNVTRPGELILARGNSSPLSYVQTRDYLVFASTSQAIRDAWKSVIGTPPAVHKIRYMLEGNALIVREGGVRLTTFSPGNNPRAKTTLAGKYAPLPRLYLSAVAGLERDDDPEDEGLTCAQCEDCGDWVLLSEMEAFSAFSHGSVDLLCEFCAKWARHSLALDR
jgi:asparagine synthetase B (glutamine-hydrolysing)